jgi:hypothetical protein
MARIDILIGAKMPSHPNRFAVALLTPVLLPVLLMLSLLWACGRSPADDAASSASQKLPFDRQPRSAGISPSQSLIPSTTKLPEGTTIPIRLQSALSSASSRAGESFNATIDEPVLIDGQALVARGTPAIGRVLEAKASASSRRTSLGSPLGSSVDSSLESSLEPGYLRIVLVSLNVGGKTVMIETSSIFAKGGSREDRNSSAGAASGASQKSKDKDKDRDKDIVIGVDRRLNFRLAQAVDLQ